MVEESTRHKGVKNIATSENATIYAPTKDSDQPENPCSLFRVFAVHLEKPMLLAEVPATLNQTADEQANFSCSCHYIATDKRGYPHDIFLISQQKHMLWYSLEVPQRGTSNEYHNICFC